MTSWLSGWLQAITAHAEFSISEIDECLIHMQLIPKILNGYKHPKPEGCDVRLYNELMLKCWEFDRNRRLSFKQIFDFLVKYQDCLI